MKHRGSLGLLCLVLASISVSGQTISFDGQYRINPVYSRGFREPMYEGDKPGLYTMQRTRLILNYTKKEDLLSEIIIQDRRFWGEDSDRADVPHMSVFRAWVEKYVSPKFSVRLGRQGFVYDEQHILGDPDWVGTRAHDAALFKYETGGLKVHFAAAYNANGQELKREVYKMNTYRNMQFAWLRKDFGEHYLTFTAMNRGMEKGDTSSSYMQTFGPFVKLALTDKLAFKGLYYHQLGETDDAKDVNAWFYSAQIIFNPSKTLQLIAGVDAGSGTDQSQYENVASKESNTFDRQYGLLHGHFGYLDYFYVMAPTKFGVSDYYIKAKINATERLTIQNHLHDFVSSGSINDPSVEGKKMNHQLGIENDLIIQYKLSDNFKASLGHSIMFGTSTLDAAFGGEKSLDNQVFYAVIIADLNFFKTQKD